MTMTTLPSLLSELDPKRRKSLKKGVLEEYKKYRKANSGVFQPVRKTKKKKKKGGGLIFAKRSNVAAAGAAAVRANNRGGTGFVGERRRHTYDSSTTLRTGVSVVKGIPTAGAGATGSSDILSSLLAPASPSSPSSSASEGLRQKIKKTKSKKKKKKKKKEEGMSENALLGLTGKTGGFQKHTFRSSRRASISATLAMSKMGIEMEVGVGSGVRGGRERYRTL